MCVLNPPDAFVLAPTVSWHPFPQSSLVIVSKMEVRRRNVPVEKPRSSDSALEFVQTLDVFPKLPKECQKSTEFGGLGRLIASVIAPLFSVGSNLVFHGRFDDIGNMEIRHTGIPIFI